MNIYFKIILIGIILLTLELLIIGTLVETSLQPHYPTEEKTIGTWEYMRFKNHKYVVWSFGYRGSAVHDPDCPCHQEKKD